MYGKHFRSMYTGSMYGKSATVFAVWGYVISHFEPSRKDGQCYVTLNPAALAGIFSTTPEVILDALAVLEAPDPASQSKENDGRRLVLLSEPRGVGPLHYLVVNGPKYRAIRDEEDRRAYLAEAQRLHRARAAEVAQSALPGLAPPEDAPAPATGAPERRRVSAPPSTYSEPFLRAWAAYPHVAERRNKKAAWEVWFRFGLDPLVEGVLGWIASAASSPGWTKDGGEWVPAMEVWLKRVDFTEPPPPPPKPRGPAGKASKDKFEGVDYGPEVL